MNVEKPAGLWQDFTRFQNVHLPRSKEGHNAFIEVVFRLSILELARAVYFQDNLVIIEDQFDPRLIPDVIKVFKTYYTE
jgi:hypothetical protein